MSGFLLVYICLRSVTDRCSKCWCNFLHQFLLGAFRTDDVLFVGNETATNQRRFADGADEAIVVPVTVLERDETGTADSGDWLDTGGASLGEKFPEALGTVGFLVAAGEALPGQ